jgi:SAM-dependent methyltransferase
MTPKPAARLVWAVDAMAVGPADRVLEIGCGHGVAVSLVCRRLDGGHVTAIDRSPRMIAAAAKRNAAHVAAGRASFQVAALDAADLGEARYDKALAIHVPVFLRGDPARELAVVGRHLADGGRLYVVDQPPRAAAVAPTAERVAGALERHGFAVERVVSEDLGGGTAVCVVARPL